MAECRYRDPTCPCQDGDVCHYVDTDTTKRMDVPTSYVDLILEELAAAREENERLAGSVDDLVDWTT